jgi:predicted DNA repair protein MutK
MLMATSLLLLLDDIASVLDDVATMTKVAATKTAGVVGDDLALNAKQVIGVDPARELAVVWAVAKGSAVNKAILVPAALLIGWLVPWAIPPLLIAGGAFLCYEGAEKILHALSHRGGHGSGPDLAPGHAAAAAGRATEDTKIAGAIRTDFILSAEIIVITLGIVAGKPLVTQVGVLVTVAILMTIGVYGPGRPGPGDRGGRALADAGPFDRRHRGDVFRGGRNRRPPAAGRAPPPARAARPTRHRHPRRCDRGPAGAAQVG